ncbi:hypothetical protein [Pseudoduganella umbonata]|uniref:Uncharacterized protein n=1 Tax=Pseudoduganella umbonata TaxID=864828 RepID=A0A4P8HX67_9BURK|nr:hypothetical protein [Pseudoduganella umbonata]MBB3224476.1 hypothetical protein [Pseudoduganella umbonata]QCP13250.1 hypothetical protein FCL38_24585 [Pseudoduganella umbonata]
MRSIASLVQIALLLALGAVRIIIELLALFAGATENKQRKTQYDPRYSWENDGYSWERPDNDDFCRSRPFSDWRH